jgi:hypothetical protein
MSDIDRFHKYVMPEPNTGCWLWSRPLRNGYGLFSIKRKTVSAHRYSFEYYKHLITNNSDVCHSCDVASCVNPDHLFLGTHQENMNDRDKKGRCQKGEKHYRTKLSNIQITIIREACSKGFSNASIGRYFNVSRNVIWYIKNEWTWKSI